MSERTLILLRHAKSDWAGQQADIDRPLAERGVRQAPRSGRWLFANIRRIDLAVVSPAERARATWELAADECDDAPPTTIDRRVYAASARQLLDVVHDLPDEAHTVVIVGHNPGMEQLASALTGRSVSMPTSAHAVIGWEGSWSTAGQAGATLLASGRGDHRP